MPRREQLLVTAICGLLVFTTAVVQAQVPQKINYQVMLTDDDDQPLVNQSVQLVFGIYDVESGGSPLWTETQDVSTNSIGVVSVILGAVDPVDIDFDGPRWLEVEVGGETLSPRREMVTAPFAARAAIASDSEKLGDVAASEYVLLDDIDGPGTVNAPGNPVDWGMLKNVPAGFADGTDDQGTGDGHSLDADDGSPTDALYVDGDGQVGIGTTTPDAELQVEGDVRVQSEGLESNFRMGAGDPVTDGAIIQVTEASGGVLALRDETGAGSANMGSWPNPGGGGFLQVYRDESENVGFSVLGNSFGSGEPSVSISGTARSATFDMAQEGDDSVALPEDAVGSTEVLDEPGVASIQAEPWVNLPTGNVLTVAARTIIVPADGFVYVAATAHIQMVNLPSEAHYSAFGVSEVEGAWSSHAQEAYIQLPSGLPTGYYDQHVAVSGLFAVTEGSHTFYLNAEELNGEVSVRARQLNLMYFPTQYGTVDTTD